MALPRKEQDPQRLRSVPLFDNLHLENSSETMGSQGNKWLTYWRWRTTSFTSVSQRRRTPTALQRSNRGKCAHLLRDLDAAADLPLHCARFSLCSCWT